MNQSAALEHLLNTALRRIAELDEMVAAQAQEIFDLRRQLTKNSSNSSKPPSSDGLKNRHHAACVKSLEREAEARLATGAIHYAKQQRPTLWSDMNLHSAAGVNAP